MEFEQAMKYLQAAGVFGSRLGLANMEKLLTQMGNPHKKLKYIHVAGTNGKGSTSAYISHILTAAGYKAGLYTSPHIGIINERIKVDGSNISDADFSRITGNIQKAIEALLIAGDEHPTEFEIITAIAFEYFYESRCDLVVLEVGLGGRLDATNIIDSPEAAVITAIDLDHIEQLGTTLTQIAFEKGGIIKQHSDVVLYAQSSEVESEIERICTEREAALHRAGYGKAVIRRSTLFGQEFSWREHERLEISLLGKHQICNAILAIRTIDILNGKGWKITKQAIKDGLRNTTWPGRFEVLSKAPVFIVDGAHNTSGTGILADTLKHYFPDKKVTFLMGVLSDKQYAKMLQSLIPLARRFITVTPDSYRALAAPKLAEIIRQYHHDVVACDSVEEGVHRTLDISEQDEVICAFGSLYMVGTIRDCFPLST